PCLAGGEHHEVRREVETEHLVHFEPSVLCAVRDQIHEREQRILLAEDAIGREVQDAAAGRFTTKRGFGRRATGENLTGSAATEATFRREAPSRRILHLATYGILSKQNPLFSFVDLVADSAQDGRLEVHEVFGLHLAADLVVLSACQTGLGAGAL